MQSPVITRWRRPESNLSQFSATFLSPVFSRTLVPHQTAVSAASTIFPLCCLKTKVAFSRASLETN